MPKTRRKRRKRKTHSKISRKKRGGAVTPLPTQASADERAHVEAVQRRALEHARGIPHRDGPPPGGVRAGAGGRRPDGRWMLTARHPGGAGTRTEKIERHNNDRNIGTLWNKMREIIRVINRCHMPPRDNCLD